MGAPSQTQSERALAYQARLRGLSVHLADVHETERKNFARELHDRVGHELGLSRIILSEVMRSGKHRITPALHQQLANIEKHLKQAVRQTRSLGYNYCPQVLYEAGFLSALNWLAEDYSTRNDIQLRIETDPPTGIIPIPQNVRPRLFAAVRECVYNACKYAKAREVILRLTLRPDQTILMEVSDDGKGFDVDILDSANQKKRGFGLFSIREMIDFSGGKFFCISSPGKGTTIRMELPPGL